MSKASMYKAAKGPLREGFTTGSAATAACMAAFALLLGEEGPLVVSVPLPPPESPDYSAISSSGPAPSAGPSTGPSTGPSAGPSSPGDEDRASVLAPPPGFLPVPVHSCTRLSSTEATATVIKDGGDDPDATHKAAIVAHVCLTPEAGELRLTGGEGVGRITLPGLPLPVGEWAINPAPRRQMACGLGAKAAAHDYKGGISCVISVPGGEAIAQKTFNPRLGIVGGISILGTQGTVRPYSNAAWKATIVQGLHVAAATGCQSLCLSTGRRSERLLLQKYPELPAQAAVQVADFAEFSLQAAGELPFKTLIWGCFFGKLVKLAQGHGHTHAHEAQLDFALLARWCREAGALVPGMEACVTANHALDMLLSECPLSECALNAAKDNATRMALTSIARKAANVAQSFAQKPVRIHLFHLNGTELLHL